MGVYNLNKSFENMDKDYATAENLLPDAESAVFAEKQLSKQ